MRFLFINQYYAPDYAATAQLMADLCEALARLGHDVHVLSSRSLYDGREMTLPEREVINGVQVHRIEIATGQRDRFRQRLAGYMSFYAKAFLKIHALPTPDVVVTLTTPPLISLLGTWLRVTRKTRFVHWVMDVYPDIAIKAGVLSSWGPVRCLWSTLGRVSYMTANRVVVLGHDMKAQVARKGAGEKKIEVIQCWASAEEVKPEDPATNPFRAAHMREGVFTLMYSGNMGACHTFGEVIGGIRELNQGGEAVDFAFVGGGKKLPQLKASLEGARNVKFLPYQDRKDLHYSLSAPDAHLVTLDSVFDGLLVPSKLYAIMAAARPIVFVGSEANDVARVIRAAGCGVIVKPGDKAGFAAAVRRLAASPAEREAMGERAREYLLRHFERDVLVERFGIMLEREGLKPGVRGFRKLADRTLAFFKPHPSGEPPVLVRQE